MRAVSRAFVALVFVGCGDNESAPIDASSIDTPLAIDGAAGPDALGCTQVLGEPALGLELVASGLPNPVQLVSPPGDPRLFVVLQDGYVRVIEDGEVLDPPFLNITDEVGIGYEQGLLSLAFHPDYASNRRFFLSYARDSDEALVVEEWLTSETDPGKADDSSRVQLLEAAHDAEYHYGSHLVFAPSGLLYISVGDGGPQLDPDRNAENLASLRGKLLRIDIDETGARTPYGIPDGNPLKGMPDVREEIVAYGLRNPWRIAIDPATLRIFLGDVGFASWEEIDVLEGAHDELETFGWSVLEANRCMDASDCDTTGLTPPIYEYPHSEGCAIVLGPVYRGCAMPGHHGRLFFGDFCGGWVRSLLYSFGEVGFVQEHAGLAIEPPLSGFGVDALGEMYVLAWKEGAIYKIVAENP